MTKTRCRQPSIPKQLRKETTEHLRSIARRYRHLFRDDRDLKNRIIRLAHVLLPPRPRRRGRPGNPTVTRAIALYSRLRRKYPEERPRAIWHDRVCPLVITEYAHMGEMEQNAAYDQLRERVSWRRRKRRKIPAQIHCCPKQS